MGQRLNLGVYLLVLVTPTLFSGLLAGVLGLSTARLFGQAVTSAQLTVRITDPSGAVIPGAAVTVTNTDTGTSRETMSSMEGYCTVPLLEPGRYRVDVVSQGFRPASRIDIVLQVGQRARVNLELELGERAEASISSPKRRCWPPKVLILAK